jgi:hypothetical protein
VPQIVPVEVGEARLFDGRSDGSEGSASPRPEMRRKACEKPCAYLHRKRAKNRMNWNAFRRAEIK